MIPIILFGLALGSATPAADIQGEWINSRRTAVIRIADCSSGLCGTVVWTAAAAQRDALRGGTAHLDGATVMWAFIPMSMHRWRCSLFLPDQNRTVKATVELPANARLRVRGCELAGLVCKSQTWTRWAAE